MSPQARRRFALFLLVLTPAFWGVNHLIARAAPAVIEPHLLALLRWSFAGLLFAVPTWRELRRHRDHLAAEWRRYLVLGALGMWICGAWVYIGGRTTAAVNISLIYVLAPVVIALLSAWWLKERVGRVQMVGVLLALVGVVHVVVHGRWATLGQVQFVPGDAWIFAATLAWALYSLLLRRWASPLSPMARLAAISAAGIVVLLPFAAWDVIQSPGPALTPNGVGLALLAGVGAGANVLRFGRFQNAEWSAAALA